MTVVSDDEVPRYVAEIVTDPSVMAVTMPVPLTVAIAVFDEVQVDDADTFRVVPSEKFAVAVNWPVPPADNCGPVIVIDVTVGDGVVEHAVTASAIAAASMSVFKCRVMRSLLVPLGGHDRRSA
jgi:hypothetical protein